jgi:drug/metabolite transporter (DMT)-like permease
MTATPISSMLLVLFASVVGSFGAVFLKLGAVRLTDVWSLLNWRLLLGVGLYLGSSVFYGWGIKNGQISVLFPMVSLGYVWTMVWARLFFKEPFTRQKFMGLGMILLGVLFVGLGSK